MKDHIELKAIEEPPKFYDELEERLRKFFRLVLYYPILKEMDVPRGTIKNAAHPNPLMDALFIGRVVYTGGAFRGKFSAGISKELKSIGATFDRATSSYQLPFNQVPPEIKNLIHAGEINFQRKMQKLDAKLAKLIPEELAEQFKCEDIFDKTLYHADRSFKENIKKVAIPTELTPQQRLKISKDWQNNMRLYIKDWTEKQIKDLRKDLLEQIIKGASRTDILPPILKVTKTIQKSHEQAVNKAKFLARQESRLLMASFKESRYQDAGVHEYIWRCVHRPHDTDPRHHTPGNVRYSHGLLEGKIFRFDDPPVSTNPGQPTRRNNPGTDYRCRCFPRPLLRKKV